MFACKGDFWEIDSNTVPVLNKAEQPANKQAYIRSVIALPVRGDRLEILETGFLSTWKQVLFENYIEGWINADWDFHAHRVEKGIYCPEK